MSDGSTAEPSPSHASFINPVRRAMSSGRLVPFSVTLTTAGSTIVGACASFARARSRVRSSR